MAVTVLLILAAAFLIYGVLMLLHRGPVIPCVHYFILSPEEQAQVKTDREYRNTGLYMLAFAAACLAGCLIHQYIAGWFWKYVVILVASLVIYVSTYDLKPKKWEDMPESQAKRPGGSAGIL